MPSKWGTTTLREIAEFKFSNVDKHIVHGEASVRLCNYLDVYRNRKLTANMPYSEGSARPAEIKRFAIQKGDVLITKDSETPDDIGVPALVVDELPNTICGYHLAIIRANGKIDPCFLTLHLLSEKAKCHFLRFANGVTRFGLGLRAISTLPVPLPPPDEQQAIARILDAVDVAMERTRTAITTAEKLKSGLIQQSLKRCSKAKSPIERLDKVAEIGSGVTLGRDLSGSATVHLPYLRVANVQDGFLDLDEIKTVKVRPSEIERFSLAADDVLLTEGGDFDKLGRGAVWTGEISPCLHQNHIFRVRADRTKLEPHFLAMLIGSEYGKRFFLRIAKRTTNLASINKTQLSSFPVMLPSLKEQEAFVGLLAGVDRLIKTNEAASRNLAKLKRGLMQDLLTGRVRVKLPASSGNGVVRSRT